MYRDGSYKKEPVLVTKGEKERMNEERKKKVIDEITTPPREKSGQGSRQSLGQSLGQSLRQNNKFRQKWDQKGKRNKNHTYAKKYR
jgi:hypothetical protein